MRLLDPVDQMDLSAFLHIEDVDHLADVAKNLITAGALLVGAIWAYWRFVRERTRWPRAALSLEFSDRRLDDSTVLLSVKLDLTNEGRGLMRLSELRFDLYRVLPLEEKMRAKIIAGCAFAGDSFEADWPDIESRERVWPDDEKPEIEPGESDSYCCDFFLNPIEETVFLYAYLHNVKKGRFKKKKLGWTVAGFHQLPVHGLEGGQTVEIAGGVR